MEAHFPKAFGVKSVLLGLVFSANVSSGAARYEPFADVAELAPRRFEEFCERADAKTGLAKCRHAISKTLDDDGEVHFSWAVEMKPDSVLSLDTEEEHGVKITYCDESNLHLELPEAYARYASEGTIIVASRFAHPCRHLGSKKHMLRRVVAVKQLAKTTSPSSVTRAHVVTKAHRSFAEVFPSAAFNFSYMPIEARDLHNAFPPMKTKRHGVNGRRLDQFGETVYDGHPQSSSSSDFGVDSQNGLIDFEPNQLSNFGWNWNFYLNSTEEPEFNYTLPGMSGFVKLKQPYIKIHAGIFLNFSSKFGEVMEMKPPKVMWKAGILSHGHINARMMTDMRTTQDASEDPFSLFNVPMLEKLKETNWLEAIDMAMGPMPMTVEPGFQFKAELYHTGAFDGTLQLGGETKFAALPEIEFNSDTGLFATMKADFEDSTLYPPLWIIATKHFEMGLMLEPVAWVKGDFGDSPNDEAKMGFEIRPYLNVTISRESDSTSVVGDEMRTLITYPYRIIGLPTTELTKKYAVKISANGETLRSTPALNWGQVEITDHMSTFNAGQIPQQAVLTNPITVTLVEVDASNAETELGSGSVTCGSLLNGECQPNPTIAEITVNGATVRVELAILWMNNPVPWFASRIRGVALSFPSVALNSAAVSATVPELANGQKPTQKMFLRATHASRTYVTEISGLDSFATTGGGTLSGASVIEFGPTFLESWTPCGEAECESGKIQLFYGSTLIGQNKMPQIPFSSSISDLVNTGDYHEEHAPTLFDMMNGAEDTGSVMQNMMMRGFNSMAAGQMFESKVPQNIPLSISLFSTQSANTPSPSDGSTGNTNIAVIHATATVVPPSVSSIFLQPAKPEDVAQGDQKSFVWTVAYVQAGQPYNFRLSTWKVVATPATDLTASASFPSVGDKTLQPVANSQQQMNAACTQTPIAGMSADESPCSFSHLITFDAAHYAAGDGVVLMVEWIDGGKDHVMFSAPFLITAPAGGRRLQGRPQAPTRRMWTQEDWDARLAANEDSCKNQDLHFEIGFGMMMRGKMVDSDMPMMPMLMPGGMGMTSTSDGAPMLSTGFQKVGQADMLNSDADRLFPSWLCADGVCSGKMPGCTKADFKTMYFPTLVFHFNRNFEYADLDENFPIKPDMVKMAMAYAFSTLPEVVDLLLEELNGTSTTTGPPFVFPSTTASLQWPMAVNAIPGTASTTVPPTYWAGGRRLRNAGSNKVAVAGSKRMFSNKVTMKFKGGVPFVVDRPLVEMMMRHGMFQDVEDDATKEGKGRLFIRDFEVYSDVEGKVSAKDDSPNAAALDKPWAWMYSRRAGRARPLLSTSVVVGVVAAFASAVVVLVIRSKRAAYGYLNPTSAVQDDDSLSEQDAAE